IVGDPKFSDIQLNDFTLNSGSSAIGSGIIREGVPSVDIRSNIRPDSPDKPDIGCYQTEFQCPLDKYCCQCFDYKIQDDTLYAWMPCGEQIDWYINDMTGFKIGSNVSEFKRALSSLGNISNLI